MKCERSVDQYDTSVGQRKTQNRKTVYKEITQPRKKAPAIEFIGDERCKLIPKSSTRTWTLEGKC